MAQRTGTSALMARHSAWLSALKWNHETVRPRNVNWVLNVGGPASSRPFLPALQVADRLEHALDMLHRMSRPLRLRCAYRFACFHDAGSALRVG